jgi:hypothetical protein
MNLIPLQAGVPEYLDLMRYLSTSTKRPDGVPEYLDYLIVASSSARLQGVRLPQPSG